MNNYLSSYADLLKRDSWVSTIRKQLFPPPKLKVVSLFDGISVTQVALQRLGLAPEMYDYYASEIDTNAMKITKYRHPNTKFVGDVTNLLGEDFEDTFLLVAGSPCQGFSRAGTRTNFEHSESKLFWHFVRLLQEIKPKYFLLENVKMKKEWQDVISNAVGVEPIKINSADFSAQNRVRLYWTNIPVDTSKITPTNVVLRDVLEDIPLESEYPNWLKLPKGSDGKLRGELVKDVNSEKSFTMTASMHKGQVCGYIKSTEKNPFKPCVPYEPSTRKTICKRVATATDVRGQDHMLRVYSSEGKSPTITAEGVGGKLTKIYAGAIRGRPNEQGKNVQRLELRKDSKTNTITTVQKDNVVVEETKHYYRNLTIREIERLQTLPDDYTDCEVAKTNRIKCLGNSFTAAVIEHILRCI